MDIDIVHRQSKENIEKLIAFLKKVDAIHRCPDDKILKPETRDLSGRGHALFTTRYGPLDVLAIIEDGRGYEDLLPYTVEIEFRGYKVRMLTLKTLVEIKQRSRDPKGPSKAASPAGSASSIKRKQRRGLLRIERTSLEDAVQHFGLGENGNLMSRNFYPALGGKDKGLFQGSCFFLAYGMMEYWNDGIMGNKTGKSNFKSF